MKNSLRQIFRSPKFLTGFIIMVMLFLTLLIYPIFNPGDPLAMIGRDSFIRPGTYVNLYDSLQVLPHRTTTFVLDDAAQNRFEARLSPEDRERMLDYFRLIAAHHGVPYEEIDPADTDTLVRHWWEVYDPELRLGATAAERNFFIRLDARIAGLLYSDDVRVYEYYRPTGEYQHFRTITDTEFVNVRDVANVVRLPLGTDNFGRDMLKQLVAATGVSLRIGVLAGVIATAIGLLLGLISGYVGGIVDDFIMFIVNLFTVIPGFVLLVLISFSIGQEQRGAMVVAMVIGLTSWVWTTRSVRAQVISLRNRDHVNLSKLSGHSLPRIILTDILPYIASYVVMAFILQISTAILAEAQLSMLGLGPRTTEVPTLGLMMNWALAFGAHTRGNWWAYYPVIMVIALVSFALNLMNTGLDQVFNPQLRE